MKTWSDMHPAKTGCSLEARDNGRPSDIPFWKGVKFRVVRIVRLMIEWRRDRWNRIHAHAPLEKFASGASLPEIPMGTPIAVRQAWAGIVGPTNGPLLPRPSTLTISSFHADLFVRPIRDRRHPQLTELPNRIMQFDISDVGCVRI